MSFSTMKYSVFYALNSLSYSHHPCQWISVYSYSSVPLLFLLPKPFTHQLSSPRAPELGAFRVRTLALFFMELEYKFHMAEIMSVSLQNLNIESEKKNIESDI